MLKIIKHLNTKQWLQMPLVFLFAVLQVRFDLLIPDYMRRITVLVQTPGSEIGDILIAGGYMLLCALASLTCVIVVSFFASRISSALSMRLRDLLFSKVGSFSIEEFSRFSTSSLIARSTNDITQVQQFTMSGMQMIIKIPILAVGGILGIAGSGVEWTVAALIAFAFVLVVIACTMVVVIPQFNKMQGLVDKLNMTVRQSLTGRYVLRAFGAEAYHEERFETANGAFTNADRTTNRAMAVMSPVMSLGTNGVNLAVYVIGAVLISSAGRAESLTLFSNMVVMSFYLGLLFTAVKFITKVLPRAPRALVSAKRITEVLETEPSIKEGTLAEGKPGSRGEVEFLNVGFRYPGAVRNALEDVSFTVKQGETVAIIGPIGSGKTTLVDLVMRFFNATEGQVLINGEDIRQYTQEALNNKLGYVPQSSVLFKGTIGSNVAYGDNGRGGFSPSDIQRAVSIARAQEFVEKLEEGLETAVSQRGANFSGGQKQRISIARAICREPEILVFDDSFSALDYRTDSEVRGALKSETAGATKLIVAQRIGSIMDADQIIVLDEGRVAGKGTHEQLMRSCGVYREIVVSQLGEGVGA